MPSVGDVTVMRPASGCAAIVLAERSAAVEADVLVDGGKARQHRAIPQAQREEAAGLAADPGVEILEIFREHRSLDHAGKAAVLVAAPPADAEERRALIGRPRLQRRADIGADFAVDMGLEIIAVRKIDLGRGHDQAVGERMALGVENPGRFHLRQRIRKLLQPLMQGLLAGNDAGIGDAADDLGDLRQACGRWFRTLSARARARHPACARSRGRRLAGSKPRTARMQRRTTPAEAPTRRPSSTAAVSANCVVRSARALRVLRGAYCKIRLGTKRLTGDGTRSVN